VYLPQNRKKSSPEVHLFVLFLKFMQIYSICRDVCILSEVEYVLRPDDSESTLTENSDGTAHDISILSGDAHPEDIQGEEMEIGSASDTAEVEDETPQDTESKTPVPVPVRRSARERRQPALLNSGQYNVSKSATCIKQTSLQQQIPEWQQIADLSHLYVKHKFVQV
jgi:hypothetical protein